MRKVFSLTAYEAETFVPVLERSMFANDSYAYSLRSAFSRSFHYEFDK